MSRYAVLTPDRRRPPRAGRAPFGFRELWLTEWVLRDEPIRRTQISRAIHDARDNLLVSDALRYVMPGPDGVPELGRPRISVRRAAAMPFETPLYVVTVVVYPKGALP